VVVLDLTASKKMPRLFLAHGEDHFSVIPGVTFVWPDRSESAVYDLSWAGIAVAAQGVVGKLRIGSNFEIKLRIEGVVEALPLKVRIVRLTAKMVGFVLESLSSDGRMILDQITKDRLVAKNLRQAPPGDLQPQLQSADLWFHGPFDTNIFIWRKNIPGEILRAVVEYDNLLWVYDEGRIHMMKSGSATDEARGYYNSTEMFSPPRVKILMGASWMDRCLRCLDAVADQAPELALLLKLMRAFRDQ